MAIDFNEVKEQATGRWLSIWRALGIEVDETGRHNKCPNCGGTDRFRVDKNVAEKGSFFCSQCKSGFGPDLVMRVLQIDYKEAMLAIAKIVGTCEKNAVPIEKEADPAYLRKIFLGSKKVAIGDPVHTYLRKRGLSKIPVDLRYHPGTWEPDTKQKQIAMLAIMHVVDGTAVNIHRTFLGKDYKKLPIKDAKKFLSGKQKMDGGAVRLYPVEGKTLGIAEGIETAIAASELNGIPVWAALNNGFLEKWDCPKEVQNVVVFGDNDANYTGQKSAFILANKLAIHGKNVTVEIPEIVGEDWLDVLTKGA